MTFENFWKILKDLGIRKNDRAIDSLSLFLCLDKDCDDYISFKKIRKTIEYFAHSKYFQTFDTKKRKKGSAYE
jgi:hypothetical protein